MRRKLPFLAPLLAATLAPAARPQKQASTLEMLTRRAPMAFLAEISSVAHGANSLIVTLTVRERLRGDAPTARVIREGAHRHCGGACTGLRKGQRIAFFGTQAHDRLVPTGGSRGIVTLDRGVLDAIRELLATKEPIARIRLVATGLDHANPRVREDAALALPLMQRLEDADAQTKTRIRKKLAASATSRDATRFGMLMAAIRAVPLAAATHAWEMWLDDRVPQLQSFAAKILVEDLRPQQAVTAAPLRATTVDRRKRVAVLLGRLSGTAKRAPLFQLAGDRDFGVRCEAVASLLQTGSETAQLEANFGKDVMRAAHDLVARRARPKRFRAIRPQRK